MPASLCSAPLPHALPPTRGAGRPSGARALSAAGERKTMPPREPRGAPNTPLPPDRRATRASHPPLAPRALRRNRRLGIPRVVDDLPELARERRQPVAECFQELLALPGRCHGRVARHAAPRELVVVRRIAQ